MDFKLRRFSPIPVSLIISFCLTSILPFSLSAQQLGTSVLDEVSKQFAQAVDDKKVIGHTALIYHNDQIVFRESWGQSNREKDLPVKDDTIFRIYSMTKPVTSVAVMQLVEAGKLKLDDPIQNYLKEFSDLKVQDGDKEVVLKRPMTVRDLLRHTSGLTYGFFGNTPVDQKYRENQILIFDKNIEQTVSKLGKLPLFLQPGKRFHYSVSADVLGRLVEVASGKRFGEYLQTNIFEPLGMKDTFFTIPKEKQARLAQMYNGNSKDLAPSSLMLSFRYLNPNDFESGGGGLCSTMNDYLQFAKMLMNKGTLDGKQLLAAETVKQMFTNQLADVEESSPSFQFGLGFRCFSEGDFGWGGFAGTRFYVHPEKKSVILYMTQLYPYGSRPWANKFRKAAYQFIDAQAAKSE